MRIYKNDIIKASAISTGADRGVLLCSITDSGFTSIAGVISAVKDKLPGKDHKKMIFEIGKQRMKKCLNTLRPGGQKYFIVRFLPCVDSMARKMYVNTKSYDIKNNNQRILFH